MKLQINHIYHGDALAVLKTFPDESINMCMTSPPYWGLRDYGVDGQIGLEAKPEIFVEKLIEIFNEVKRVLRKDGTCWVNLGDTYGGANSRASSGGRAGFGAKREGIFNRGIEKCMMMIPERFTIAMIDNGWILRNKIIWHKLNPMPSSTQDRFGNTWEYLFFFSKSKKYWFDLDAVRAKRQINENRPDGVVRNREYGYQGKYKEGWRKSEKDCKVADKKDEKTMRMPDKWDNPLGKNPGDLWDIATHPYPEAHFATYPEKLCIKPIKAGCPEGGIVLDPFAGAATTLMTAKKLNRQYIGIELNPEYIKIAEKRIESECGRLF